MAPTQKTQAPKPATATAVTAPEPTSTAGTEEAKSRFNAAIGEAKAGAAALKSEASARGHDMADDAFARAGDLAVEGKAKASDALVSLSKLVEENAAMIDEKFGAKYGDYARRASGYLTDSAKTLNEKSYEELGEDAREAIRKSPATAVGIAAIAGFLVSRLFRR